MVHYSKNLFTYLKGASGTGLLGFLCSIIEAKQFNRLSKQT